MSSQGGAVSAYPLVSVVDIAHEAFVGMDSDGLITAWNPAAESAFGWTREEAVGRAVADTIIPEDLRERRREGLARFLEQGEGPVLGRRLELEAVDRDGRRFPIEITISSLKADGRWTFYAFMHDISDRRREAELRDRTAGYREVQLAVANVLAVSATVEEAMPEVLAALGRGFDWAAGSWWRVSADDGALRCGEVWSDDGGAPMTDFQSLSRELSFDVGEGLPGIVAQGGAAVWLENLSTNPRYPRAASARLAGLRGAVAVALMRGDTPIGILEFFSHELRERDDELIETISVVGSQVSQFIGRKQAEADAERVKEEFFGLVSHELRTPLTAVIGYAEMLAMTEGDRLSEQGREMVEVINRNARREMRLVGDLLLLVQIEAGSFELRPGSMELERVVRDSVATVKPQAEEAGVELEVVADAIPPVPGDGDRIGQTVENLLTNAIKFTPEGGRVRVHVRRDAGNAIVEVEDSGEGIEPEDQAHLFDRLYRTQSAAMNHVPGTGLGLTIVKAIVDAHGGEVAVASEPGEGATFTVALPFAGRGAVS